MSLFFLFKDPSPNEIYTLSLHDALPISRRGAIAAMWPSSMPISIGALFGCPARRALRMMRSTPLRSEEHTSELQSHVNLVCRLLLEKKKKNTIVIRARHILRFIAGQSLC